MITLESILIDRNEIGRVYRGRSTLCFWRGLSLDNERLNPLYPDLEQRILPSGDVRDPDIDKELRNGVWYVKAEVGKGTSIVDREGIFGYKKWEYFVIPAGTKIPKALIITKDHYMQRKKCRHYSISPNFDMPVEEYLKALDTLALNAGIEIRGGRHANYR
jgi:hypothetical protein